MKKLLIVAGVVLALSLGLVGLASADNGPHGGYTATTDACAGCHRAHTAKATNLLVNGQAENGTFCQTCHDGSGAYTNVWDGVLTDGGSDFPTYTADTDLKDYTTITGTKGAATGVNLVNINAPLRGGGFLNAKMNTDLETVPSGSTSTTSRHEISGTLSTVWGFGAYGTNTAGRQNIALTCTNCHNPHGSAGLDTSNAPTATYRLLKGTNTSNTGLFEDGTTEVTRSVVNVADEGLTKTYSITNTDSAIYFWGSTHHTDTVTGLPVWPGQTTDYYKTQVNQITSWCTGCHTRYMGKAASGDPVQNTGDSVFQFQHPTNIAGISYGPACLTCHVAHGTTAKMGAYSNAVPFPGTSTGGTTANARSSLLRLDNRGVCEQCHFK